VEKAMIPISSIIRLLGPGEASVLDDVEPHVFDDAGENRRRGDPRISSKSREHPPGVPRL
jgi:hypothetical protein